MKKIRLSCFLLVVVLLLTTTTACGGTEENDFEARDIVFHYEYTTYYGFEEAEPYLQAYFKSIEIACHQVLEEGAETFALSEAGEVAQKKLENLQKSGDAAIKNADSTTRAQFHSMFLPYLEVRTQELTANLSLSFGNTPKKACEALLEVLNEAYAAYAAAP